MFHLMVIQKLFIKYKSDLNNNIMIHFDEGVSLIILVTESSK